MIASYKRTDLLERLFRRVKKIQWKGGEYLPGLCDLPPEMLLRYIKDAEGENLAFALDALVETYAARKEGYPLLITKLSNGSALTRLVVIRHLNEIAHMRNGTGMWMLPVLQDHLAREIDPVVRKEAQDVVEYLEEK